MRELDKWRRGTGELTADMTDYLKGEVDPKDWWEYEFHHRELRLPIRLEAAPDNVTVRAFGLRVRCVSLSRVEYGTN